MATEPWHEQTTMPALLRLGRGTYGEAIRVRLAAEGCDDMPPNGPFLVGATARTGSPLGDIIRLMGISKQAAGQLVDTLVERGYLRRSPDPEDRRKVTVELTDRGSQAASAASAAITAVDAALELRVGPEGLRCARAALAALVEAGPLFAAPAEPET